jgi:hypothetical protein
MYYITSGKHGAVDLSAMAIDDADNFYTKLKSNITDTALRDYFVNRTLADSKAAREATEQIPDFLTAEEAWEYLRIGRTKFFQLVKLSEIKKGPNNRYSKDELDRYFHSLEY